MEQIKILHLEDNPYDAELISATLAEGGLECDVTVVDTEKDFKDAFARELPDIVLADYALPSFDGLSVLLFVKDKYPLIPVILVSGSLGEEIAVESLKFGAADYVLKIGLNRLVPAVVGALHEKKELAMRLEAEEKILRLKAAIEYSSDAVMTSALIVTDKYNKIVLMNRPAEILLDAYFTNIFKQSINTILPDHALWNEALKAAEKDKAHIFDFEVSNVKSGKERTLRGRTSELSDKSTDNTGIVMIINDITHDREIERLKNEFISTAAHELRTPLTSIQGFSEILLTRDNLDEAERKKFLRYINKQAVSLAMIVNDLFDISRLETQTDFSLEESAFSLKKTIEDVIAFFKENSPGHHFRISLPDENVEVLADREKIEQVLKNILSNAVKYSPRGGTIEVSGELLGRCYQVAVKDVGAGMTPEQLARIFDKFYRADASDGVVEGTGLGMTIVKKIIEAHGCKVLVKSELGAGTTVHFTVPANIKKKE